MTWRAAFADAWDRSYGEMLYGKIGFLTKDGGEQFTVDKFLVMNYIDALLDEKLKKQKEKIVDELWNMPIDKVGDSSNTLKQAIELISKIN